MSLWPGLPLPMSDFSLANANTKIAESFRKIDGFGITNNFNGILSDPTQQANTVFRKSQEQLGVNNVLGLSNPSGASILSSQTTTFSTSITKDFMVKLYPAGAAGSGITIKATPVISESRQANWDTLPVMHHPGEILAYKSTTARTWSLQDVKLVSRTPEEAGENLILLNIIRSWVMPYYGFGTEKSLKEKLGAPPPILIFSAYGEGNIGPLPVVLLSYSFNYPNDIDMIPTKFKNSGRDGILEDGTPFPILSELTLELKESYSPTEYSSFDLLSYKKGNLKEAYNIKNIGNSILPKTSASDSSERSETLINNQPQNAQYSEINGLDSSIYYGSNFNNKDTSD